MRRTVRSPSASSSASAGGKRAVAASSGSSQHHLDLVRPRHAGQRAAHEGDGVEVGRRRSARRRAIRTAPKRSARRARGSPRPWSCAGTYQRPPWATSAVRAQLALGLGALARRVPRLHAPPADHGLGEQQQVLAAGRRRAARPAGDLQRLLERLDPQPHAVGQHAVELGERAVGVEPVAPRGEQAERDGRRLAGGEAAAAASGSRAAGGSRRPGRARPRRGSPARAATRRRGAPCACRRRAGRRAPARWPTGGPGAPPAARARERSWP